MVKIVYMYSRRARIYDMTYTECHENDEFSDHVLGDEFIIPADAKMDGIDVCASLISY